MADGERMNPPSGAANNLSFRVSELEKDRDTDHQTLVEQGRKVDAHELELHGERGVNATLRALADEIKWLRRALWGLAASVTVAAVVFGLSTLGGPS